MVGYTSEFATIIFDLTCHLCLYLQPIAGGQLFPFGKYITFAWKAADAVSHVSNCVLLVGESRNVSNCFGYSSGSFNSPSSYVLPHPC